MKIKMQTLSEHEIEFSIDEAIEMKIAVSRAIRYLEKALDMEKSCHLSTDMTIEELVKMQALEKKLSKIFD